MSLSNRLAYVARSACARSRSWLHGHLSTVPKTTELTSLMSSGLGYGVGRKDGVKPVA